MKISTKGRYALRLMIDLAMNSNGKPDMTRMPVVMKEGKTYEAID